MSSDSPVNLAASVRARLKNKAGELGLTFDQVLKYYAMERFLFRLSKTRWADALVVKGAAMLRVWDGAVARPTRELDFLGRIDSSPESIESMMRDCLDVLAEDGLEFSSDVAVEPITIEDRYPGAPAGIQGKLSGARIVLQLDIGVADVAVPDPAWVDYPVLLDMESPRILAYHPSTAIAEKFETMIEKGLPPALMNHPSAAARPPLATARACSRTTHPISAASAPGQDKIAAYALGGGYDASGEHAVTVRPRR